MDYLDIAEPWLGQILPQGWPTGTSSLITGPGGSGKPLIGNVIVANWLKQGGSVVFMALLGFNWSVATGVGFIALAGVAAETGGVAVVDVPEVPKSANAGAGDGRICRREHVTGSIRKVRVCRTPAKINMERQASQQALRELNRQTVTQEGDP